MSTAVDDVHHRNGECVGVAATDIAVKRHAQSLGSSVSSSQRDTQDSVSTQLALSRSTVESDHLIVQTALVEDAVTLQSGSDDVVDIGNSLQHALATETALITVAKLQGLVLTGAGT